MDEHSEQVARGRALSSPLRLQILRICLHTPRTNKEIADVLGITPAACLHHVRTLARTGFLEPLETRRGNRGAKEIPYRATGASWRTPLGLGESTLLLDTFLQEIQDLPPDALDTIRMGFKLNRAHRDEYTRRLQELIEEFKDLPPDPDGEAFSVFYAEHPDPQAD
ncbi:winged helix-turn-helix domain-containing protein [Nocardioides sp.]|uniref:winged helix-turn-helix domain-containing protein n=1 Tax=Nocardioides sp. TaxID=35761 RepID=UPI0027360DBC|nr:winged helix-turn-helix domain-containing protein [Nocardioides sp.]MDP3893279.1 winged helix-turn-helix domain-containing protein [Nocardioides sp.]